MTRMAPIWEAIPTYLPKARALSGERKPFFPGFFSGLSNGRLFFRGFGRRCIGATSGGADLAAGWGSPAHSTVDIEGGSCRHDEFVGANVSCNHGFLPDYEGVLYLDGPIECSFDDGIGTVDFSCHLARGADDDFGVTKKFSLDRAIDADVTLGMDRTLDGSSLDQTIERVGTARAALACIFSFAVFFLVVEHNSVLILHCNYTPSAWQLGAGN